MYIKADREYLAPFIDNVIQGKYQVPRFQRDFVWSIRQMMDLFDSILKGFPIGSIILWHPESAQFSVFDSVGGVDAHSDYQPAHYVLDGRQRITTLLSVLNSGGEFGKKVYVDLDNLDIIHIPSGKTDKLNLLLLSEAFDSYALIDYMERLKKSDLADEQRKLYAEQAKKVNRMLYDYEIGYITVNGGDLRDAVSIFSRLNSKATIISEDFMIQALAYDKDENGEEFLFSQRISEIISGLESFNFSGLNHDQVLKCVYNYTEKPFFDGDYRDILRLGKDQGLSNVMKRVGDDVYLAVEFLFKHCAVIDLKLIPYSYQFVMVALFFKDNPHPSEEQLDELKRWFFYTTYVNYFTNTSLTNIRKDFEQFKRFSKREVDSPITYSSIKISALPVKWTLGSVRVCGFVQASLLASPEKESESLHLYLVRTLIDRCAGNTVCCRSKEEYSSVESAFRNKEWSDVLENHCVTKELFKLFLDGQYEEFISKRTALLLQRESEVLETIMGKGVLYI